MMNSNMQVPAHAQSGSIEGVVIRCTCGHPESHVGEVCPQGKRINYGTMSYYHRNPLRQLAWNVFNSLRTKWRVLWKSHY